jgi:hypothetical protein
MSFLGNPEYATICSGGTSRLWRRRAVSSASASKSRKSAERSSLMRRGYDVATILSGVTLCSALSARRMRSNSAAGTGLLL